MECDASGTAEQSSADNKADLFLNERLPVLDGVRGVAILFVLVHHQFKYMPVDGLLRWVEGQTSRMWVGVDLFFVLSGFLITRRLLSTREKPHYFRDFYAKRSLRIFPLYFGTLALVLIAYRVGLADREGMLGYWWWWGYLGNFRIANEGNWFPEYGLPNVQHFWSLCVEEHFYLIWPLLVSLIPVRRCWWFIYALLIFPFVRVWIIGRWGGIGAYVLTPARLDSLMIGGCLTYVIARYGTVPIRRIAIYSIPLALFGWVVAYPHMQTSDPWMWRGGFTVMGLLFAHLIALAITSQGLLKWLFNHKALRVYGKYSYGLYVIHGVLLPWLFYTTVRDWFDASISNKWLRIGLYAAFCQIVFFVLAYGSYHLYEKHFLRLKRYFGGTDETQ